MRTPSCSSSTTPRTWAPRANSWLRQRLVAPGADRSAALAVRTVLLTLLIVLGPAAAWAQDEPIPPRHATTANHVDVPGHDIQSLFDVTLTRCHAACLGNGDCAAFTFNQRNGSCFLKDAAPDTQGYIDAVSGFVSEVDAAVLERAREAALTLDFLDDYDFQLAREQALGMAENYPAERESEAYWLALAAERAPAQAVPAAGAAVTVTDSGRAWLTYATARLALAEAAKTRSYDLTRRAVSAAVNAALRLPEQERADALLLMARGLEGISRGEAALEAVRLADRLAPGIAPEELARLRERFGFRVLRDEVEAVSAAPRICVWFSQELDPAADHSSFVQLSTPGLAVEVEGSQLCVSGVQYGENYQLTLRAGLPSAEGETLPVDVTVNSYIRDRSPVVRFPGRAYVLPAAGPRALPIETVNANHLELKLLRVSDRNLVATIRQGDFLRAMSGWEGDRFEELMTEGVWEGEAFLDGQLNHATTSLLPLDEVGELTPGVYVLRAGLAGDTDRAVAPTMQWFLVSDLGVTTLAGNDGVHVVVQRLSDAAPVAGLHVSLLARSNRVLGEATTDDSGHVHFPSGLALGSGNSAPAAVLVEGEGDFTVISLEEPEFDLTDRGVEGREAPGPLDVFMTTDRGAYRPGETIHLTVLVRDARASAVSGLPLTLRLLRPDGVEYSEVLSAGDAAGGYVVHLPLGPTAPLGAWRVEAYVDTTAAPLATSTVLVEEFVPERIGVELALAGGAAEADLVDAAAGPVLEVEARHLFGAPAAGMSVVGSVRLSGSSTLPDWPGYRFGRLDRSATSQLRLLPAGLLTDEEGRLEVALPLERLELDAVPYTMEVVATVLDGSSRPVERTLTRHLQPTAPVIGIRPGFEGALPENGDATFDLVLVDEEGRAAAGELTWQVDRVETNYQWFSSGGRWYWEPITQRQRIAEGSVSTSGAPARVSVPVTWGRYELRVSLAGEPGTSAATEFIAGWYAADAARETPDLLQVSLDAGSYAPGDTASLRILPEEPGVALVTVLSDRVVHMRLVEVEGETLVELPVTEEWGAGAYVTVSLVRPSGGPEHLPTRSLGLDHASVEPGERQLTVTLVAPAEVRSGEELTAVLEVAGLPDGVAHATVAAVDLGILNLTGFTAPDPSEHYFGQRRLGVAIRDLYGRLIDARQGAVGEIRSGGDSSAELSGGPIPTEDLVALFSGPVRLGDGRAEVTFRIPAWSGALRLMAVVWTATAVGEASEDVLVRDPVVVQGSLPRFMTPGDESRLRLELTHVAGDAGTMQLAVTGHGLGDVPATVELSPNGRAVLDLPLAPTEVGEHTYDMTVTTPDGVEVRRELRLSVLHTDPETSRSERLELAPGRTLVLDDSHIQGYRPGTARLTLAAGRAAALDLPRQVNRLTGYGYGSTERLASSLLPLTLTPGLVVELGLVEVDELSERLQRTVDRLLTRQAANGSFGLWYAGGFDVWLDAYVTEALLAAEAHGAVVPEGTIRMALDNLRNRLARAGSMQDGAAGYAYAYYVLAQAGEAAIGDLRYHADVRAEAFDTPLAAAHLGAALALYGERSRSEAMFERAEQLALAETDESTWRADFGTELRDRAALLALAAEAGSAAVDRDRLVGLITADLAKRYLSTQEAAWTLRGAVALSATDAGALELDGEPLGSSVVTLDVSEARELTNVGSESVTVTLTTFGVPLTPQGAGGVGYTISRALYTPEGEPADLNAISAGDRLVTVLEITPERGVPGGLLLIDDALPAGFEIDNANLLRSGDVRALDWLQLNAGADMTEARAERFVAAVQWTSQEPLRLAYFVRAVSPGEFHHPAPLVEDAFRPTNRAVGEAGRLVIRP